MFSYLLERNYKSLRAPFFLSFSSECPIHYITGITKLFSKIYSFLNTLKHFKTDVHTFMGSIVTNFYERAICCDN